MTFTSEIVTREDIINKRNKTGRLIKITGYFMQSSSDSGGNVNLGYKTVKGPALVSVNDAAKLVYTTVSNSILTVVTETGVTSGMFQALVANEW